MPASRLTALALAVIACSIPAVRAAELPAGEFRQCLSQLRTEALGKGVRAHVFDDTLAAVEPDASVLDAMAHQPEFRIPIWDYLAALVDEQRIADGVAKLKEWEPVLARAELEFGVDRHTIVAVWGVESDYGRLLGTRPLVRSLATVSCFGTRQRFFRGELVDTLKIVQSGDFTPQALTGSWAGAFGQTQPARRR